MPDRTEIPAQPSAPAPSGWQARKSAATRLQILEATLRCFTKFGYFHTTTPAIADEAKLSRGAMLHHFPTRMDVVRAAIEHLNAKRLKAFRAAVASMPPGGNKAHVALRAHWEQLRHPLYGVFIELYVAARTDPELADVLAPAEEAFERELRRTAREVVPEWNVAGEQFEIGRDLFICTLRGMALKQLVPGATEPSEDFFRYLEEQLANLAREGRSETNGAARRASAARSARASRN
jgi:AcrR family transcriptional regulator